MSEYRPWEQVRRSAWEKRGPVLRRQYPNVKACNDLREAAEVWLLEHFPGANQTIYGHDAGWTFFDPVMDIPNGNQVLQVMGIVHEKWTICLYSFQRVENGPKEFHVAIEVPTELDAIELALCI